MFAEANVPPKITTALKPQRSLEVPIFMHTRYIETSDEAQCITRLLHAKQMYTAVFIFISVGKLLPLLLHTQHGVVINGRMAAETSEHKMEIRLTVAETLHPQFELYGCC